MKKTLPIILLLASLQILCSAQTELTFDVLSTKDILVFDNYDTSVGQYAHVIFFGDNTGMKNKGVMRVVDKETGDVVKSENFNMARLANNIAELYIDCGIEGQKYNRKLFFVLAIIAEDKLCLYNTEDKPIGLLELKR